jgi:hypothetical protein
MKRWYIFISNMGKSGTYTDFLGIKKADAKVKFDKIIKLRKSRGMGVDYYSLKAREVSKGRR